MTRYQTIVADPPWHYEGVATSPGSSEKNRRGDGVVVVKAPFPYPTLSVDSIAGLPVAAMAAPDSRLFLWTTNAYLPDAFKVIASWGFTYKQTLVWHKTGNPSPFGGSVAPNHAEFLLVAQRGSPTVLRRLPGSVIAAAKPYAHSFKPELFLDLVEQVSPEPRLEMFSRRARLGWDVWGNEVDSHVEIEAFNDAWKVQA